MREQQRQRRPEVTDPNQKSHTLRKRITIEQVEALPVMLTLDEVCNLVGLSRPTVTELADKGALPGMKIGTSYRFPTLQVMRACGLVDESGRLAVDPVGPMRLSAAKAQAAPRDPEAEAERWVRQWDNYGCQ